MALPSAQIALAITAGCCAALYISVYSFQCVSRPHTISLYIDHTITPESRKLLAHAINNACHTTLPTAQNLTKSLQTVLPITHTLTIKQMPGKTHITLSAQKPVVYVQCADNPCYITSHATQQSPKCYNSWCNENIPHITTPQTSQNIDTQCILQWTLASDYALINQYKTLWHSNHNIILTPLDETCFIIATTGLQAFTFDSYKKIQPLENIYKEKNYEKKIKKRWKADLRFSDRIIVSPYTQGIS